MENPNKLKEEQESINTKKDYLIKDKFLREFSKTFLAGKDRNKFIEEIMKNDSIDDSSLLKRKLKAFKSFIGDEDLKNFDESKISIYDLRAQVAKDFTSLENTRDLYFQYLLDHYDLNDKDLEKIKSSDNFKNASVSQIEELLKNENKSLNLLRSILNKNIKGKYSLNIFDTLTDKELQKRLEKIGKQSPELAHNLKLALLRIFQGQTNGEDFRFLFDSGVLTLEEKKQLLKKFVPYLTLKEALDYGLINSQKLEDYKREIFEYYIKDKNLSDEDKEKLLEVLPLDAIKISSNKLLDGATELSLGTLIKDYNFNGLSDSVNEKFKEAKEELERDSNIELLKRIGLDIEKVKKGSVLEIILPEKSEDGEKSSFEEHYFFEIKDLDDSGFILKDIGKNDDIHYSGESKRFTYLELVKFLEKESGKAKVYTKKDFQKTITNDSKFNVDSSYEYKYSISNEEERKEIETELLEDLYSKKNNLEKELNSLNSGTGKYAGLSEKEKIDKQKELQRELEETDKKITELNNNKLSDKELLEDYNFIKFLAELDSIDKEGKELGFKKGIFIEKGKGLFETKGEGGGAYEILDIWKEKGKVKLKSLAGIELVDFENFLKILKKDKGKRIKKISNFEEIINDKLNNSHWKNIKVKDGKLIDKDSEYGGEKKDREVKFLVGDKIDKVVKINEINGDRVKAQFGTIKDLSDDEKKKKKYKKEDDVHELKLGDEIDISLNELNKYINDFELYPDWKIGQKSIAKESPKDLQNDIKGSFSTRLFNRYSISELIAGGKLMVAGIEEYFKKGNDIHAAKFALGLGQILPEEVRADLKIKVEREEAEAMDKAIDSLGKVDSNIATRRIKRWLLNRDTPEFKKEAGLMFMLQKYGVLYAKELTEYKGKFLWYEAFGGRIGDALYNEVKEDSEKNNVPFSEEKLMHMLLKKQCKGDLKPERRSRLHKDYEGKWKTGVKEEFEKGYDDASKKRNATEMVRGGMGEAFGGTIPNAIGWFKKAVERGDTPEVMSEGFFSLIYSGVLGQQDENLLVRLKDLWDGDGLPIVMIRFASNKGDLDFFNRMVLELSRRISEVDKQNFPNIYSDAEKIFKKVVSGEGTEKSRLEEAQNFWKKYGTVLSRALYFQDIGESDTSRTDKIVLIEKDKNPIFEKYYDMVRAFTGISGAFNQGLMDDESGEHGLGGLNHNEIIKRFFRMDSGRSIPSKNISVVERLWRKISEDVNSVREKNMEIVGGDDLENKRKYLKLVFRDIFAGFITNHPDKLFLKKYVEASPFKDDMKKWGITEDLISRFLNYSAGEIEAGNPGSDSLIDEIIDNVLGIKSTNGQVFSTNRVFKDVEATKEAVNNITYSPEENRQAA